MDAARTLLQMDEHHAIKHEFINMLLQLAQGESNVLDQVAGLPPTLPAGPEMAKEARLRSWMKGRRHSVQQHSRSANSTAMRSCFGKP